MKIRDVVTLTDNNDLLRAGLLGHIYGWEIRICGLKGNPPALDTMQSMRRIFEGLLDSCSDDVDVDEVDGTFWGTTAGSRDHKPLSDEVWSSQIAQIRTDLGSMAGTTQFYAHQAIVHLLEDLHRRIRDIERHGAKLRIKQED